MQPDNPTFLNIAALDQDGEWVIATESEAADAIQTPCLGHHCPEAFAHAYRYYYSWWSSTTLYKASNYDTVGVCPRCWTRIPREALLLYNRMVEVWPLLTQRPVRDYLRHRIAV